MKTKVSDDSLRVRGDDIMLVLGAGCGSEGCNDDGGGHGGDWSLGMGGGDQHEWCCSTAAVLHNIVSLCLNISRVHFTLTGSSVPCQTC